MTDAGGPNFFMWAVFLLLVFLFTMVGPQILR